MNRIILFFLLCLYSLFVSAQNAEPLYSRNDSIVEIIAEKYAKNNGEDSMMVASLKQSIIDAFDSYWKKAKTSFKTSALNKLKDDCNTLQATVDSLSEEIKKKKQETQETDTAALNRQLEHARQEAERAKLEKTRMDSTLGAWRQQVVEARTKVDEFKSSGNDIIALQSSIVEGINKAKAQCTGSLEEAQLDIMTSAWKTFNANKESLRTLMEPTEMNKLEPEALTIYNFIPFFSKVQEAIRQMKEEKFDEKKNISLMNSLNKAPKGLTKEQQTERKNLVNALKYQTNAYKNLTTIINDLLEKSRNNVKFDVNDTINEWTSYLDFLDWKGILENINGKKCYSHYYGKINSVLEDIRKNASGKKGEKLTKYLKNLEF